MSLDKGILHKKEHRKKYISGTAKDVDVYCRNHQGCHICRENRFYKYKKTEMSFDNKLKSYYEENEEASQLSG